MDNQTLLQQGIHTLKQNPCHKNPQKEAILWLSHLLQCEALEVWTTPQQKITSHIAQAFFVGIDRLAQGEPIEYLTQKVSFYGQDFFIDKGVLIPRPESELLIDKALPCLDKTQTNIIAEIGVGSGVLSITLAMRLPHAQFIGTDINEKALQITRQNAIKYGVQERLSLHHTGYLDRVSTNAIDMLIANPPYINDGYAIDDKLKHEPPEALFGGKNGDEILRHIIDIAFEYSTTAQLKWLLCEIGYDQQQRINSYIKRLGKPYQQLLFYQDWSHLDRGFVLQF